MFFNEWNILVVDDEPDVLAVTRLALRDVKVYGLPVKIHTARSKAEAVELLKGPLSLQGSSEPIVAVALVDVVMESDHAGLELCKYIRDEARGHSVQLFIRTGQPGVAPERSVIDEYDISGYFTKVELSEQKLYTLVKTGVRQWFTSWYALMTEESTNNIVTHSGSRKDFLENGIGWFGEPGPQEGEGVTGFIFDRDLIVSDYPDQIRPLYDRLNSIPPVIQTADGHKLAMDEMGNLLVRTVKTRTTADYVYVGESSMVMPRLLLDLTFKSGLVFSTLWKKITDEEKRMASGKPAPRKIRSKPDLKKTAKSVKKAVAGKTGRKPVKKITKAASGKKR
ncbi:MAG: response regulator receiver protein [Chloroflexi bacterium]|nr:response regulator receiver protein [Chloroflexota bacterium]